MAVVVCLVASVTNDKAHAGRGNGASFSRSAHFFIQFGRLPTFMTSLLPTFPLPVQLGTTPPLIPNHMKTQLNITH